MDQSLVSGGFAADMGFRVSVAGLFGRDRIQMSRDNGRMFRRLW